MKVRNKIEEKVNKTNNMSFVFLTAYVTSASATYNNIIIVKGNKIRKIISTMKTIIPLKFFSQ